MAGSAKKRKRRRWLWWSVGGLIVLSIIVLTPGSPNGCYLELGDYFNTTEGYTFTYIGDGHVFSCNEYEDHPWNSGSFRYEDGVGWVFTLRGGSHRRALMKPHLLFIRFSDLDAGDRPVTAPFQWRDPFFWKTSPVLRRLKPGASTNSAVLRHETGYTMPNKIGADNRASRLQFHGSRFFIHLVAGSAPLTGSVSDLQR